MQHDEEAAAFSSSCSRRSRIGGGAAPAAAAQQTPRCCIGKGEAETAVIALFPYRLAVGREDQQLCVGRKYCT